MLHEARKLGISAVWLQPGTFNDAVLRFARGAADKKAGEAAQADAGAAFETVVAGDGGRGDEGWCVLMDGERALKANGKL